MPDVPVAREPAFKGHWENTIIDGVLVNSVWVVDEETPDA
jgi:hypothetical protein